MSDARHPSATGRAESIDMARTRELLRNDPYARWEAIASFSLSTASAAADMKRLLNAQKLTGANCEEAIQHCEDVIRRTYRLLFGTELGE